MDRKKFLKSFCTLCGMGVVGTTALLEGCQKSVLSTDPQGPTVNFTLDLTQARNVILNTPGGSVASNGVVVVNLGGSFTAVAQTCTHAGCSVYYNPNGNNFPCPCHVGVYDIHGNVIAGPPPAPIKEYSVTKNGNVLTISG